jgi:hypothetical protein
LRVHGSILALALWSIYIWSLTTPTLRDRYGNLKGTDFLHFYTLGSLARDHRGADLYDINAQAVLAVQRVPDSAGIRYLPLYPPQLSILFAPLAYLSYRWALALWWAGTALTYGACCYAVWKACPNLLELGGTVAIMAVAYPAFFHLIAWGQTSALALAFFTGAFVLLRNQRDFGAGLVLGGLIFKPQLGLAVAIVFASIAAWKILAGALLSAGAQLASGYFYFGWAPFRAWLRTLVAVPTLLSSFEPRLYHTHCLRTFWSMLVPWDGLAFGLYAISAAVVLAWTIAIWKSREPLSLRYAALLLATVLVSPHLTVYDLVILAPGILLLVDWRIRQPQVPAGIGILLYLVFSLPLLGPFTRWTHLQLSVVVMTALLYLIWKVKVRGPKGAERPTGAS